MTRKRGEGGWRWMGRRKGVWERETESEGGESERRDGDVTVARIEAATGRMQAKDDSA